VYPGVRCDIPAHVYQSTFEPNTEWSEVFAQGGEIQEYWRKVADKHSVHQYLKLSHQVRDLRWDGASGKWSVRVENLLSQQESVEEFDYVLTAIGRFNAWKLPDYPGRDEYKGLLRHASHYDPSADLTGKRVAVIGNGASGIQLVANIQKRVKQLDHYARSKTWVTESFAGDVTSITPIEIPAEAKASFSDPKAYLAYRKREEGSYWRGFRGWLKGTPENEARRADYTRIYQERLAKKPELLSRVVPDFSPGCRRPTPGPGYLEAISEDNVEYIQTPIKRFTETGIETTDGRHREVDAIFCATGANRDQVPPFKIYANGKELGEMWESDGEHGGPYTYLGVSSPGFPNLGFILGPHGFGSTGTLPYGVEAQIAFYARLLRKIDLEGIKSIQAKKDATDDFVQWTDEFFKRTVLSDRCSSWYNGGKPDGRVHGPWPGSAGHLATALRQPRWEDWDYEFLRGSGNRFEWFFGDGVTAKELDPEVDVTGYLKDPADVDLRGVHESWWEIP
jgi:cation diffusion facilitator CzcD-associated flavoprotein CzcO